MGIDKIQLNILRIKVNTYFILFLLLLFFGSTAEAQYWERIKNIPAPYANNYWLDVYFLPSNPSYGWICGFNGMVLRTSDGGATWSGSTIPSADHMESVCFATPLIGYVSGAQGIFKSTDGGINWTNVTPASSSGLWGNFFMDANTGVVVGSGCLTDQEFWRTTNGGIDWTLFNGTEPNSGLCDAVIYPTGEGYASSSGRIWRTTDAGVSWSIFDTTGTEVWHEEIANNGQSFLVPYSGTTCSGGGQAGGMRFTTNNGVSWNTFDAGEPMFGAFLIDNQKGWACGYNRTLYYTSNGGVNWVSKNCGIYPGNLDDIWFIDPGIGWVVGQGVYKLSPSTQTVTKTMLSFPEACVNNPRWDTLYVNNFSDQLKSGDFTITGADAADFSVSVPLSSSFSLAQCDSQVFIVKFNPKSLGVKNALLRINIQTGPTFDITLTGKANQNTTKLSDTLLTVNPAKCGIKTDATLHLTTAQSDEFVQTVQFSSGDKDISCATVVPFKINTNGSDIIFTFTPKDTGWQTARYKLRLTPCDIDTFVTIRYYGVSPIIDAQFKSEIMENCKLFLLDTIPVCNTGNEVLQISKADFIDKNTGYSIIGLASKQSLPVSINPGECDTIFLKFEPILPGIVSTRLRLENNDVTTARGDRSPFDIGLKATQVTSKISIKDSLFDLGKICINDTIVRSSFIYNNGNLNDYILRPVISGIDISSSVGTGFYPNSINKNDSVKIAVTIRKQNPGIFSDTILYVSSQCNDTVRLIVKGEAVFSGLNVNPDVISGIVFTNQSISRTVMLKNFGLTDIKIINYNFQPLLPSSWQVKLLNTLPLMINSRDSVLLTFEFLATADTVLNTKLCLETESLCPVSACLNIQLESSSRSVEIYPDSLNFGTVLCQAEQKYDTVYIANTGQVNDTLLKIEIVPAGSEFSILNNVALPYQLIPGDVVKIAVRYDASAMKSSRAELHAESSNMRGKDFIVALSGEFMKSILRSDSLYCNFNTLERCDTPRVIKWWVYNDGNLDDTLILKSSKGIRGFSLSPLDTMPLKAKDSLEITLSCDPADFTANGSFSENYIFTMLNCPDKLSIRADVLIIEPKLTSNSMIINFGTVWINSSLEKELVIYNNTPYSQKIKSADFLSGNFTFAMAYNFPMIVPPDDSVKLRIRFDAVKVGQFTDTLRLISGNSCIDTLRIKLSATVPSEVYQPLISIADYFAEPGQYLSIFVHSDSVLPRVDVSRFMINISFDKWLFLPLKAYSLLTSPKQEVPFTYTNGKFVLDISRPYTDNFFIKAADIIEIYGMTFVSSPDFTDLTIDTVYIQGNKELLVTKHDGFLKIAPVCHPIAALRYRLIPNVELSTIIQNTDKGEISFSISNYTGRGKIKISDINGRMLYESGMEFTTKNEMKTLSFMPESDGFYLMNILLDNGNILTGTIMIVR